MLYIDLTLPVSALTQLPLPVHKQAHILSCGNYKRLICPLSFVVAIQLEGQKGRPLVNFGMKNVAFVRFLPLAAVLLPPSLSLSLAMLLLL